MAKNIEVERLKRSEDALDRVASALTEHDLHRAAAITLSLQIFGGTKKIRNGRDIRGQIHMGFVVDTAVNTPNLVNHILKLTPNATKVNASNSTYTGLIGTVRSLGPDKDWFLEPGPLTDEDTDLLVIQNPEDLDEKSINCLKEIAGSGELTISKKGYHRTIPVDTAILLIGNPSEGEWDPYTEISEQLPISSKLMPYLDTIYADFEKEGQSSDILSAATDVMQEYIRQAHELTPQIPGNVDEKLSEALAEIHIDKLDKNTVPQTAAGSLRRLTEAHAKARFADRVTVEDAQQVIPIYRRRFEQIEIIDIEGLTTDHLFPKENRRRRIIQRLFAANEGPIAESELLEQATQNGVTRRDTLLILGELKSKSEVDFNNDHEWYAYSAVLD